MTISSIKAVLFDLDGTLIDSEFFYYSNWAPILKEEFGLNITFNDWIKDFAGHTLSANVQMLKERFDIHTDDEFMWQRTRANYAKADMTTIRLMPFVKETLHTLHAKGIRTALVTSSYMSTVNTVLGHHNLLDDFEFFVTREAVQYPKPDPEPYLLATERLALPSNSIIAVEDTLTGFRAATGAGLRCVAVTKHQAEKERLSQAEFLVEDLSQFLDIIV